MALTCFHNNTWGVFDAERTHWDDEIPADSPVVQPPSEADTPLGELKKMCLDWKVKGHTFHSSAESPPRDLWETNDAMMKCKS